MRQAKYWFGLILLTVVFVFIIKVRDRLEEFSSEVKEQSQFNYSYLGHRTYLRRVALKLYDGAAKEIHLLDPLALSLATKRWSLPQLIKHLQGQVPQTCSGGCNGRWYEAIVETSRTMGEELNFQPPVEGFEKRLQEDFQLQLQVLIEHKPERPLYIDLNETKIPSFDVLELDESQKQLLLFFDPELKSLAINGQDFIFKNIKSSDQLHKYGDNLAQLNSLVDWLHFNYLRGRGDDLAMWQEYGQIQSQVGPVHPRHLASMNWLRESRGQPPISPRAIIRPSGYDNLNELTLYAE